MRRVLVLALLAMVLPVAAMADGIQIVNKNGSISISPAGIVSKGSHLHQFNGVIAQPGHDLGSVSFSTGALISGSLQTGGIFSDVGAASERKGRGEGEPAGDHRVELKRGS